MNPIINQIVNVLPGLKGRASSLRVLTLATLLGAFSPAYAQRYEAEASTGVTRTGATTITNSSAANGGQYVDMNASSGIRWNFNNGASAPTHADIAFRIKAPSGERYMGVYLNGVKVGVLFCDSNAWQLQSLAVRLPAGANYVELIDSEPYNEFDVDYLEVIYCIDAESTSVTRAGTTSVVNDTGASGGKYVDLNPGSSVKWTVNRSIAGPVNLAFAIKSPGGTKRRMGLFVNGGEIATIFTQSAGWDRQSFSANLLVNNNTIELKDKDATKDEEFDVDYLSVNNSFKGNGIAHLLVCCRGKNLGTKFLVNGQFIGNHDYNVQSQTDDILQKIKDAGINIVSLDLTNPSQWRTFRPEFEAITLKVIQGCNEKGMQLIMFIGSGYSAAEKMQFNITENTPFEFWANITDLIWNEYATKGYYRKYGYNNSNNVLDNRPILLYYVSGKQYEQLYNAASTTTKAKFDRFKIGTAQANSEISAADLRESDGWGYRRLWQNTTGTVRYTSPNSGLAPGGDGEPLWVKIDAANWEYQLLKVRSASRYSIYGAYDDVADSIFWGIADTGVSQKNHHKYPGNDSLYYYRVIQRVLKDR